MVSFLYPNYIYIHLFIRHLEGLHICSKYIFSYQYVHSTSELFLSSVPSYSIKFQSSANPNSSLVLPHTLLRHVISKTFTNNFILLSNTYASLSYIIVPIAIPSYLSDSIDNVCNMPSSY